MGPKSSIASFSPVASSSLLPNGINIEIREIARVLGHRCRFAGHVRRFYSIAEHSVHVSRLCPPEAALWGLLHDAGEAFLNTGRSLGNLINPHVPFEEVERQLQKAILTHFELPPVQPASVTAADETMLLIEWRDLMAAQDGRIIIGAELAAITSLSVAAPWSPEVAEARFLARFEELGGKR